MLPGSAYKLPNEVRIRAAGTPRILRTVEDALAMIAALLREIVQRPRWTFAKALLQESIKTQKSRDLKTATLQLQQAISNEKWS
jgi:UDP:flavonoid glycosyltransferase YjiC (YdhE family)